MGAFLSVIMIIAFIYVLRLIVKELKIPTEVVFFVVLLFLIGLVDIYRKSSGF